MRVLVIVVATLCLATAPDVRAQEIRASSVDAVVIGLAGGRLAVLRAEGTGVVVGGVVDDQASGTAPDIRTGDRVIALQGTRNLTLERLRTLHDEIATGAMVTITLQRGEAAEHQLRFAKPAPAPGRRIAVSTGAGGAGAWVTGDGPSDVAEIVLAGARIRNNAQGMPEVTHRTADPAAATVPLRTGDVITGVNGQSIAALAGLKLFLDRAAEGSEVVLTVTRAGQEMTVRFPKPAAR